MTITGEEERGMLERDGQAEYRRRKEIAAGAPSRRGRSWEHDGPKLRRLASMGLSIGRCARVLGRTDAALASYASNNGIRFKGKWKRSAILSEGEGE